MKDIKFYKLMIFVNALVPLALMGWDWWRGQVGANPLDFVTRTTGTLTLVFLMLTLAVSPFRKWTGVQWLIRFRHYYLLGKSDTRKPLIFAAVLAVLLGFRLFTSYTKRLKAKPVSISQQAR